jgi:hypothetical protein
VLPAQSAIHERRVDAAVEGGHRVRLVGGVAFLAIGVYLSVRRRRLHPLLLLCISAISFSWIEAPYDWAMYAQFAPAIPRMPSSWPLNMTWGGLPSSVPVGYISYFVLPAVLGAALGRWLSARFHWRRPTTLLTVGLVVGFCWAFLFNAIVGARLGVFYYGRVIPGLAVWEGSKHQYPLYDALAMGVQMMSSPTFWDGRIPKAELSSRCGLRSGRRVVSDHRLCPSSLSSSSETSSMARSLRPISSRSWGVG